MDPDTKETHLEPNRCKLISVYKKLDVKYKYVLGHIAVDRLPVQLAELFPLCDNDDRLGFRARINGRWADLNLVLNWRQGENVSRSLLG